MKQLKLKALQARKETGLKWYQNKQPAGDITINHKKIFHNYNSWISSNKYKMCVETG
jgi:hypothetical protein